MGNITVESLRQLPGGRFEALFSDGSRRRMAAAAAADFALYVGREFSEGEYAALLDAVSLAGAKERAMRILSARPMSERELYGRLVEKGESEEDAAACVRWLLDIHFLDDAEYAGMLVRRCRLKGYGPRRVRDELYRHKVPKALWDAAIEENMPSEEERGEALDRFLAAKLHGDAPDRAALKKASEALMRRGYAWDEIRAAVSRYQDSLTDA